MFSPIKSALLQAVKNGHLITWPGLTEHGINKHFKMTPATAMGHMYQFRQNGELGHTMANMATLWGQKCTITGVKMFTSHQLPAKG
jgi:hypothetical protein